MFPKKEPFQLWLWLPNHLIRAPKFCSLNLLSVYLYHYLNYNNASSQHQGPTNREEFHTWKARQTSCTYPFFPCPSPHHLGTQLDPVIFIVFPGSNNLLAFFFHLILSPFLSADTLLKFLLSGESRGKTTKLLIDFLQAKLCLLFLISWVPFKGLFPYPNFKVLNHKCSVINTDLANCCHEQYYIVKQPTLQWLLVFLTIPGAWNSSSLHVLRILYL